MSTTVKPWIESVHLHPDVLKEHAETDIFALDLGPLAEGTGTVAPVYRDAETFFQASYITTGLKSLLEEVLNRLAGSGGAPVLKLMTPFGGGKSHTMAALLHAAQDRKALDTLPEAKDLAKPGKVRVAVVDGQFFNATQGKEDKGIRVKTVWGWIALKLGGKAGYEIVRANDESRLSPDASDLLKLFGDEPNLILLDEVLEYLISAGGHKIHDTTLRDETLIFLKRLTVAAGNAPKTALVYSLPASNPRQAMDYLALLQTVSDLANRKDQLREPVVEDEVCRVIQRRLLEQMPDEKIAGATATAYQQVFTQARKAYATSEADERQADEEGISLRERMKSAYPFHPALIDLMRQRWASLPEYQRTRGALRFLAACLRAQHKAGKSVGVLGPGDVLLADHDVRRAMIKELGLMNQYDAVFDADLAGNSSRARRIDQRRAKENPAEVGKLAATKLATAIFLYSFGGLRRVVGNTTDMLPAGVSEQDLLAACVGPDLDSLTAKACLAELRQNCLYLHYDGVRYCFKKDPNVTLLVEQEADAVSRDEKLVNDRIRELLEERLGGHHAAIPWPADSSAIPDKDPRFLLAYLPLDFATKPAPDREAAALEMMEQCGNTPRKYRNGLALVIPSADQVEVLRRETRYLVAIDRVHKNAKKLNLTKEQQDELRERAASHANALESAFLKLYVEVWFPKLVDSKIGLEKIAVGGRPLQVTLNDRRQAMLCERTEELIMQVQRKVHDTLAPTKIIELFKLGEGTPPVLGIKCADVLSGFYSFLGFARLASDWILRRAILRGISDGVFGYTNAPSPVLGPDGKYQVPLSKVRFENVISDDEIDFDSGFLMLPQAIPLAAPAAAPAPGQSGAVSPPIAVAPPVAPSAIGQPGGPPVEQKQLELYFTADRNQLFKAWNAVANLADLAGKVTVTVRAECAKGFDKSKLNNGVLEPLREADLIQ
ncbi:MAG: DUF499 domain-containing protein [Verrucomicrobia bacterium]|nr:DUF499 domain-containing protein [Verrucomicrobiota bacterium]